MNSVKIISAIGNNDSIWPLLIRDCGCENPIKCALTYKQNKDDKFIARQATREKAIDEYCASAIWLGGIPLVGNISDKLIKKFSKFSPEVSTKLFKEDSVQGLEKNIDKFEKIAPKEVMDDLKTVQNNKKAFQNIQMGKMFAKIAIPGFLMGFALQKLNYAYTKKQTQKQSTRNTTLLNVPSFSSFKNCSKQESNLNFKGISALDIANMSQIKTMEATDVILGVGRTTTERNKKAKKEKAVGAIYAFILNYKTPKIFEKMFNKISKSIFKVNIDLDPKIINDKNFLDQIKSKQEILPKSSDFKTMLDYIDNNPQSSFAKYAKEQKIVSFLDENVRDPRKYVEKDELKTLYQNLDEFIQSAKKAVNIDDFVKTAFRAKTFCIFANILLSSFLLSYAVPKLQFLYREKFSKSKLDQGVSEYTKNM